MIVAAGHFTFGLTGTARPYLRQGWSMIETDFTWTDGPRSELVVPVAPGAGRLVMELGLTPMIMPPVMRGQRLAISVNGIDLGTEWVTGEATLGLELPATLSGAAKLNVVLACPDAMAPASLGSNPDTRILGVAVHDLLLLRMPAAPDFTVRTRPPLPTAAVGGMAAAVRFCTALDQADLAAAFESLGHNCEFGLVQRALGAEPPSLLRFANIAPRDLLRGLDAGFAGLGDPAGLRVFTERDRAREEYMVRDDRYAVRFHTCLYVGEIEPDAVATKLSRHLLFLQRKFQERLTLGGLFVLQHPAARSPAQVLPVLNLLRSHGPGALLYVTEDRGIPAGTVVQERADLFHGFIDTLPPMYEGDRINVAAWTSLCANTYRLWREGGGGA